jgi:hypothetical protein
MFSPVLEHIPTLIIFTPIVLLYLPSEIPVTPRVSRNTHRWADTLPKSTQPSLHSTFSQTVLDTSSDQIQFGDIGRHLAKLF